MLVSFYLQPCTMRNIANKPYKKQERYTQRMSRCKSDLVSRRVIAIMTWMSGHRNLNGCCMRGSGIWG